MHLTSARALPYVVYVPCATDNFKLVIVRYVFGVTYLDFEKKTSNWIRILQYVWWPAMTNYGISIQVMPCISSRIHIIIGIQWIVFATSSITHHADDDCFLVDVVTRKCTYRYTYFAKIIEQHHRQLGQPTTNTNQLTNQQNTFHYHSIIFFFSSWS